MSGPVVPPGQSPPFEVIDDTHRGGVIIIIAACTLVLSLVAVIIRAYVRLILSPPFGLDDLLLLGGTVSDLAFAFVCPSLGRPETEENDLADLLDFFFFTGRSRGAIFASFPECLTRARNLDRFA
jgi:hypothetical protein